MSKNLEREYKAFVDSQVPDLWARIEAGLDEKTAPGIPEKKTPFKVWAGLAAACVCVAVIVPVMTRTVRMESGGSNNTAPQAPESYEIMNGGNGQDTAACEDGAAGDSGGIDSIVTSDGVSADSAAGLAGEAEAAQESYCFAATVEILDADVGANSKIVYTAKVIASENPDVQADSEIKIESTETLENSRIYDLMLCEEDSDGSGQEIIYTHDR